MDDISLRAVLLLVPYVLSVKQEVVELLHSLHLSDILGSVTEIRLWREAQQQCSPKAS